MKKFVVFSQKVATKLKEKGFEIIDTGINTKNPKYTVFYFENTQELQDAIASIIDKNSNI